MCIDRSRHFRSQSTPDITDMFSRRFMMQQELGSGR